MKIGVIGIGRVGESFLYSQIFKKDDQINTFFLIDLKKESVDAVVSDLQDAAITNRNKNIFYRGDYSDCKDADIIVIAAGRAQKEDETRIKLINDNIKIIKNIAREVKKSGFNGFAIIVSNPVELLATIFKKITQFASSKIIGSGTLLDTNRLKLLLAQKFNCKSEEIENLYILGEHGDEIIVCWKQIKIRGQKIFALDSYNKDDLSFLIRQTKERAYKIIKNKGATYLGIGACLNKIIEVISSNKMEEILNLSIYLKEEGLFFSWPVKINLKINKFEVIKFPLTTEEAKKIFLVKKKFKKILGNKTIQNIK